METLPGSRPCGIARNIGRENQSVTLLSLDELIHFIKTEFSRIGADTRLTPREVIRDFIEILNIMHQNPKVAIEKILDQNFSYAKPPLEEEASGFAEFEL